MTMMDISSWSAETVVGVGLVVVMLLIVAVLAALCVQAGLFHTIHIRTTKPEFGELIVYYKCGRGAYSESGAMFTSCHTLMPQYNMLGVYYDDPVKKSSENLRYIVGVVLSEGGASVNTDDEAIMQEHGFKRALFPAVKHAVVVDFPYHSTLSCIFSVFRVYPALREYVERRELCAHPFLELYDSTKKLILFTGPLEQQDSFYVPEVLEEDMSAEEDDADMSGTGHDDDDDDDSGTESNSVRAGAVDDDAAATWEKSASLLQEEGSATPENADSVPQGSAEESETNTASSFEEIDPSETIALPTSGPTLVLPSDAITTPAAPLDTAPALSSNTVSDEGEASVQISQQQKDSPQKETTESNITTASTADPE